MELFGSELDDVGRRKHYTTLSDLYKRPWTPTNADNLGLTEMVSQLIQLLTKLLSGESGLSPPTISHAGLQLFCREKFGEKESNGDYIDYLRLSHPQIQFLSLVYADSELLFKFLQILNLHTSKSRPAEIQLYQDFILFLFNNCQDHSCFFQPIQHVLELSPGDTQLSKLFISLITRAPSRGVKGRSKPHEAAEFIQCGGGLMVLKSLITSSRQATVVSGGSNFSIQAVNKLGQKDTPYKTINDASSLVDFFPLCSAYITSGKGMSKLARSQRTVQFTYASKEKWVQLHAIFQHPVLLHNFICCVGNAETSGTAQGGPSKMAIECSVHAGQNSAMPVTPVFITSSLRIINVAFHQPVLTQHMIVHFHHPLLSNVFSVSKVEVLGTSFGTSARTIGPRASSAATLLPSQQDQEHKR